MARESARRIQCTNNAHNWGVAIHNYEQSKRWLPYGSCAVQPSKVPGGPPNYGRVGWAAHLWPYIEQSDLYERFDFSVGIATDVGSNPLCLRTQVPLYFCPSDRKGYWTASDLAVGVPQRSRGNYSLCLSNGFSRQRISGPFPNGVTAPGTAPTATSMPYGPSPFALSLVWPFYDIRHKAREITDGLSHTMFLSESVQALNDNDFDLRGDILNDSSGASTFMTVNTPNSGVDVTVCAQDPPPQLPGPCSYKYDDFGTYVSARSKHPGGVMVLFGDASVRFVVDEINLQTWQALGTMNGGEAISASALNL
jgi:hypothetical protein